MTDSCALLSDSGIGRNAVSLDKWKFILRKLRSDGLYHSLDPTKHSAELRNSGCLSKEEWELIMAEKTMTNKVFKLESFLSVRPSMFGALRNVLSKSHKPLLKTMEDAFYSFKEEMCNQKEQLTMALYSLSHELDLFEEWNIPHLCSVGCLSQKEASSVKKKDSRLSARLTDENVTKEKLMSFLTFLESEHPDFLLYVERAFWYAGKLRANNRKEPDKGGKVEAVSTYEDDGSPLGACSFLPMENLSSNTLPLRHSRSENFMASRRDDQKIRSLERELERLKEECRRLGKENSSLKRLRVSEMQEIHLIDSMTSTGERVTTLPVGSGTAALRQKVAETLDVPTEEVILSRFVSRRDDKKVVAVRDSRERILAALEQRWDEVKALPWEWATLKDEDQLPHFPNRRLIVRASAAPLHPFKVVNKVAECNDGKNFKEALPLRDGGTVKELKDAVGNWMGVLSASLVLSRRVGVVGDVDVVEAISDDCSWRGFASRDGKRWSSSQVRSRELTLDDGDVFLIAGRHRNTIRVSKRNG